MKGNSLRKGEVLFVNNSLSYLKVPMLSPKGELLIADPIIL